jgi:NitT/TauT family transport system substrate-binding protein
MLMLRRFGVLLAGLCLGWLCSAWPALADDTLRIAVGQRGVWDTSVVELGQRGGIFKKHGIALDILYTRSAAKPSRG